MESKTEWKKSAQVSGYLYGIEGIDVDRNSGAPDITHAEVRTAGSVMRLVAFDDDCARVMIAQLREACDQWESILLPTPEPAQAETVGV